MTTLQNVKALGNSILQRPLQGALGRVAAQNMAYYQNMPNLANMAQEERLRKAEDGLINVRPNRKRKLKNKALQSPLLGMTEALKTRLGENENAR